MDDMYISYVFFFKGYPVHPTVSWVDRSCFQSGLPGTPTANELALGAANRGERPPHPPHPTSGMCGVFSAPGPRTLLQCSALQRIVLKMRNDRDTDRTYITG